MEAFHHQQQQQQQPRRAWSGGFSGKLSRNGVAAGKPFRHEGVDYAEIFGGFASSCSIPVLDLPPGPPDDVSSFIDYSAVFGGFDPDDDLGVSYEELVLVPESKKQKAPNGVGRGSVETGDFFGSDFVSGHNIQGLDRDNGAFIHKDQSLPKRGLQNLDSTYEMENQRIKGYVETRTVHGNKFHAVPGNIHVADTHGAKAEIPSMDDVNGSVTERVIKNSVPPASGNNVKGPDDEKVANQQMHLKVSDTAEDIQTNEQYHSCSSSDDSESEDSSLHDYSNNVQHKVSSEVNSTNASSYSVPFSNTKNLRNDLRTEDKCSGVKSVAPKDAYSERLFASSSVNHSSVGVDNLSSQSVNDCGKIQDSEGGMVGKQKPSRTCIAKKVGKGQSEASTAKEDIPSYEQPYINSSRNTTTPLGERSNHPTTFLKVSDINLRTEPCQVPPPSRPPPKLGGTQGYRKVMMATNKQNIRGTSEMKPHNQAAKQEDQPFFDAEAISGSAAAASVAEAMEQAHARLRSAKELMERKKDSFHIRKKSLVNETVKLETKVEGPVMVDEIFEERNIPDAMENQHSEMKAFVIGDGKKTTEIPQRSTNHCDIHEEPHVISQKMDLSTSQNQVSYIRDQSAGEWKVEEQFFEFVNNDKSSKKVPEIPSYDSSKSILEASVVVTESDNLDTGLGKLADKQKENNDSLRIDAAFELEGDDVRANEPSGFCAFHEVEESNVTTDPFERSKVATFTEVEELDVAPESLSDASGEGNDEKRHDPLDSLQQDCDWDTENAEKQKLRSNDVSEHEHDDKENESSDIYSCKAAPEGNNAKQFVEVSIPEKNNIGASELDCELNDDILNLQSACKDSELHEIKKELEIPISDGCTDLGKEEYLEESKEASNEAYSHEEMMSTSDEGQMVSEKDENQTSGETSEACVPSKDEEQANTANVISENPIMECKNKNFNLDDGEKHSGTADGLSCSAPEQETQTKEPSWEYFCEKIVGKTEKVFHEDDKSQMEDSLNESKHMGCSQTEGEGDYESSPNHSVNYETNPNHSVKDNEPAAVMEDKSGCNLQGDGMLGTSEEACCSDNNIDESNDTGQNISEELPDVGKMEVNDRKNRIANEEKNTPEISKTEEQSGEERKKRELELEIERMRKLEEEREREREREKDRQAVEGATRGSRERAIAEAREKAERAAVERATAEARQRVLAEAREKAEKASNEALLLAEKASREAKLRAERAAVERATAEARERAVERALAEKSAQKAKEHAERSGANSKDWQRKENGLDNVGMRKNTSFCDLRDSREPQKYSHSSNHAMLSNEGESAIRSKARLERHQRTVERAAKALAEKNLRDTLAQREQAEKNRLAETLDAEVRRWSSGKEGNLRALLSTLQYILGPESGWQPIPLTDVITAAAVKKAYRKATLYVHPDKLQQRGANIQQKYVCEKVFDLLKEAWNRFNSEER